MSRLQRQDYNRILKNKIEWETGMQQKGILSKKQYPFLCVEGQGSE